MQRVRHQGDCQGISAATEWDPTAMMVGRWRLNPIPIIRQSGLPFRVTDSDRLVVLETTECRVESPIDGLRSGISCELCHPNFCKARLKPARNFHALRSPQETMAYQFSSLTLTNHSYH